MRRINGKRMNRVLALFTSMVLVIGLLPMPAFAAANEGGTGNSGASADLVAGSGELEGESAIPLRSANGLGLDPLEVAIAKSLITGAAYGLAQTGASWSSNKFLQALFGSQFDSSTQQKLDEILQKLDEIEKEIETLKDEVDKAQLDSILNDLKFLLGDTRPQMLYESLANIDDQVSQGKKTTREAEDARLTALTDGIGAKGQYENADLDFDRFTDNLWTAMTYQYNVTLDGKSMQLTLLQVHYELLRRSNKWEHQAYADWSSYQGKCVSLLISTLMLDRASLQARIKKLNNKNKEYDLQSRLALINNRIEQCIGYPTGLAGSDQKRTGGLFTEDTWAAQYWMYKERPDYRYYWVPGHEVLFYAEVNTQNVPQERSVSGLNDPYYLKGIKVKWSNGDMSIFDTYSVKINYDFWKPFLHYQGKDIPLASIDQLKNIYKDYGSDMHLYDIFIGEKEGNFTGLDEKGISKWWFVVDPGENNSNVGYDKHTFKADVLWCRVLSSGSASKDYATLCKYHQSSSEPNKNRHYIGIGVARSGPETYDPDSGKNNSAAPVASPAPVCMEVQHNDAYSSQTNEDLTIGYDSDSLGKIVKMTMDGKKVNEKNYKVKGDWVTISKEYLAKLKCTKHKIVLQTKKGRHTVTFKMKKGQKVTVSSNKVTKTYGAKAFKLDAKATGKLSYLSGNEKVVKVNKNGKVTVKGAGTARILVRAAETNKLATGLSIVTVKVAKAKNTISLANKSVSVQCSKLKDAKQTVATVQAKKAKGKVRYSITKAVQGKRSFAKKFSINKTTGKITAGKGLAAGTYKVTVKAKAAGNANYNSGSKTAVVTVTVK